MNKQEIWGADCAAMEERVILLACGELPPVHATVVTLHMRECAGCAGEFVRLQTLHEVVGSAAGEVPSANLLAAARIRLSDALDRQPRGGWLRRCIADWSLQLRAVPAITAVLLLVGFAGGGLTGARYARRNLPRDVQQNFQRDGRQPAAQDGSVVPASASQGLPETIASVDSIHMRPGSNLVQVNYNRLVPGTMQADANDPRVQQLLLLATQGRSTTAARADSVGLLSDQCQSGNCAQGEVRQALMAALRYDKSEIVRRKALDGLARYVGEDESVRDSVLATLLHDPDAALRTRAIQMLTPVEADNSVREVLHTVATEDRNPYLRTVSRQTLEQGPEIQ